MGRQQLYKCDFCKVERAAGILPMGWTKSSFYNGTHWVENYFCSYRCLAMWADHRIDYPARPTRPNVGMMPE